MKDDAYYTGKDITDKLTEEQFQELKALSEESANKDVISIDDFKKATRQWRAEKFDAIDEQK